MIAHGIHFVVRKLIGGHEWDTELVEGPFIKAEQAIAIKDALEEANEDPRISYDVMTTYVELKPLNYRKKSL